jgi:hypothetical protein
LPYDDELPAADAAEGMVINLTDGDIDIDIAGDYFVSGIFNVTPTSPTAVLTVDLYANGSATGIKGVTTSSGVTTPVQITVQGYGRTTAAVQPLDFRITASAGNATVNSANVSVLKVN